MSATLPPVTLPSNTWVDLYDATGITLGNQLIIQNIGSGGAVLVEKVTEPDNATGYNAILPRDFLTNNSSAVGAWAFSKLGSTLQVEEAL